MESVMKFKYAFNFSRIICCNFVTLPSTAAIGASGAKVDYQVRGKLAKLL